MAIHAIVSAAWTDPKPSVFVVFNSIKKIFADLHKTTAVSTVFSSPAIYTSTATTCPKYSNSKPAVVKMNERAMHSYYK